MNWKLWEPIPPMRDTPAGANEAWHRAMREATDLANRLNRPVQLFKTYPTGYAVCLFLLNKDGTPAEAVKGQIVYPMTPPPKSEDDDETP